MSAAISRIRVRPGRHRRALRAFTLIELLIVIVVLAILASLALPTLAAATGPLARPIADLLENDLRLARLEAMGATRSTTLVIGASRDRWWLQPADEPAQERAFPATLRIIGADLLKAYEGHRLDVTVNDEELAAGDTAVALFSASGTRDDATIRLELHSPLEGGVLARWRVDPGRTRLRDDE